MSAYLHLLRRLEALGLRVQHLDRSYASRYQLRDFAPTWSGRVVMPDGRAADLRGYYTMREFSRAPLTRWAFLRLDAPLPELEAFVEAADQPPPPWLAAWPAEPVP